MKPREESRPDADAQKGSIEDTAPESIHRPPSSEADSHDSLADQLGHRDENQDIKDNDSDFPEPGSSPEHS